MSNRVFPAKGNVWKVLERELWALRVGDQEWKHGSFLSTNT